MGIHDDPTGRRLELRRELDELRAAGEHASPRYCQLVREHAEARHAEDMAGRMADDEADEEPTYCQCGRPGRVRIAAQTWLCLGCACDGLGFAEAPGEEPIGDVARRLQDAGAIIDGDPRGPRSARVCAAAGGLSESAPFTRSRWTSYFAAEWFAAVIAGASALLDELDGPPAGPVFGPSVPCAGCGIGGHPAMAGWRHAYYQGVGFALVCPQCAPDQTEAILAYRTGADRLLGLLGLRLGEGEA